MSANAHRGAATDVVDRSAVTVTGLVLKTRHGASRRRLSLARIVQIRDTAPIRNRYGSSEPYAEAPRDITVSAIDLIQFSARDQNHSANDHPRAHVSLLECGKSRACMPHLTTAADSTLVRIRIVFYGLGMCETDSHPSIFALSTPKSCRCARAGLMVFF